MPGLARADDTQLSPANPQAALEHADAAAAQLDTPLTRQTFERHLLGTRVEITVYAEEADAAEASADAAFDEIQRLESIMSDYPQSYPDSELLLLARAAHDQPGQPIAVSDDLWPVLMRAKQVHAATDGAFDITARPLTGLWRLSQHRRELPPDEVIQQHMQLVGISHLHLDEQAQTAYLDTPGCWLDLGGLAKGYIADRALDILQAQGLPIAQVRAGGDMAFGDAPPGLQGWPVHVPDFPPGSNNRESKPDAERSEAPDLEAPDSSTQTTETTRDPLNQGLSFWIANGGASVSGDAFRFVEIEGVRYSHVIDPRTGLGVTGSRYCCVRGPSAFATDAAATAGCILNEDAFNESLEKLSEIEGPLQGWRFQGEAQKQADQGE